MKEWHARLMGTTGGLGVLLFLAFKVPFPWGLLIAPLAIMGAVGAITVVRIRARNGS